MIPAAFDYVRAESADEAIALLTEHGDDAKLLAGGHSLLPLMKLRLAQPVGAHRRRPAQRPVVRPRRRRPHRHRRPHPPPRRRAQRPAASRRSRSCRTPPAQVGDPQVRHRGTIGGSVAHGDPASDLPAALLALGGDARRHRGPTASGRSRPTDFFTGFLETALAPDELLTEIRVPKVAGAGWSFQKFNRRAQDWAIVGVAAVRATARRRRPGQHGLDADLRRRRRRTRWPAARRRPTPPQHGADEAEPQADLNASVEYRGPPRQGADASRRRSRLLNHQLLTTEARGRVLARRFSILSR